MLPVFKDEIRAAPKQEWALNNAALKTIRDGNEYPPGVPTTYDGVDLFAEDPYQIKTLHQVKGMAYELREPTQPWSWRGMLNGMQEQTLDRIVGNGIIGICCKPIEGSYDHTRRNAAREVGHPV